MKDQEFGLIGFGIGFMADGGAVEYCRAFLPDDDAYFPFIHRTQNIVDGSDKDRLTLLAAKIRLFRQILSGAS